MLWKLPFNLGFPNEEQQPGQLRHSEHFLCIDFYLDYYVFEQMNFSTSALCSPCIFLHPLSNPLSFASLYFCTALFLTPLTAASLIYSQFHRWMIGLLKQTMKCKRNFFFLPISASSVYAWLETLLQLSFCQRIRIFTGFSKTTLRIQ